MKVAVINKARVWCGAIPRRGSGQNSGTHMRTCRECRRVKAAYWEAMKSPPFLLRTVTDADRKRGGWYARNRHLYPDDWDLIAEAVKSAAGWCCEACDNPHGPPPYVLTVDHVVDSDPANVTPENLAALCQRCHLRRQGMKPLPQTKAEALRRLRRRYEGEQSQQALGL